MMQRIARKMKLIKGFELEYKKRHDAIWPELTALLSEAGISEYSIFLDEASSDLLAILKINNPDLLSNLPEQPIMQKWWAYMSDIMETNEDNSPVSILLKEVFYMP